MRNALLKAAIAAVMAAPLTLGLAAPAVASDSSASAALTLKWSFYNYYYEWGKCEGDGFGQVSLRHAHDFNCYWDGEVYELWLLVD